MKFYEIQNHEITLDLSFGIVCPLIYFSFDVVIFVLQLCNVVLLSWDVSFICMKTKKKW